MAKFELKLPKMGESVAEATITSWLKNVGDTIEMDEAVLEIATDKVDSEVPSEVDGKLVEILFQVDDLVKVGQTIAIIEIEGEDSGDTAVASPPETAEEETETAQQAAVSNSDTPQVKAAANAVNEHTSQATIIVNYTDIVSIQ